MANNTKRLDTHHDTWDQHLPFVQYVYNTSPCLDSTGYSPSFLVHGRVLQTPLDNLTHQLSETPRSAQQYVANLFHVLESARQDAEITMKERKDAMRDKFKPKVQDPGFHVGNTVYLYHPVLTSDQSAKLRSPWTGPHYIVQKFSELNVQLRRQIDNKLLPGRIHVNRLKMATDRTHLPMDLSETKPDDKANTVKFKELPQAVQAPSDNRVHSDMPQITDNSAGKSDSTDTTGTPAHPQDGTEYYEVEKIVAKRRTHDGWQYRVKWLSFPTSSNSWVESADLNPLCQRLVDKIHDTLPTYGKRKRTGRKCKH